MFTGLLKRSNWVEPPIPPPPPGDWEKLIDFHDEDSEYFGVITLAYDIDYGRLVAAINVLGGYDDHIWKSDDGGDTWAYLSMVAGLGNDSVNNMVYDAEHSTLVALMFTHDVYTSTDGGATWTARGNIGTGVHTDPELIYSGRHETVVFAAHLSGTGDTETYVSDDGGVTWVEKTLIGATYPAAITLNPSNDEIFLLIGEAGSGNNDQQVWRSTNGGNTWTFRSDLTSPLVGIDRARSITYDVEKDKLMISAQDGDWEIYSSDDDGQQWDNEGTVLDHGTRAYLNYHVEQGRLYAFDYGDPSSSAIANSSLNNGRSWVAEKVFNPDPGASSRIEVSLYVPEFEMMFIAVSDSSPRAAQLWKSNGRPI
jgi:hypothetical protein